MPKYTIYIRGEDNDKWLAIEDKPEWLHAHLEKISIAYKPTPVENRRKTKINWVNKPVILEKPLQVNPKSHNYIGGK